MRQSDGPMTALAVEFGYFPYEWDEKYGPISIATLPNLKESIEGVYASKSIYKDWLYAPPQILKDVFNNRAYQLPYASRIFGLPKTHVIRHENAAGPEHLSFLVWCLGFFVGMRLTTTEAGFLDATPLKSGALTDFVLSHQKLAPAVALTELFWQTHCIHHRRTKNIEGIIHALFLSEYPQYLQFERFTHLYTALDACYALTKSLLQGSKLTHAERIQWTCQQFSMQVPSWAQPANQKTQVSVVRNDTLHEALFFEEPLGFAVYGGSQATDKVPLEMQALVCRLLVALLGDPDNEYVKTPVNTRQRFGLKFEGSRPERMHPLRS
jgi:hypothetical protein